MRRRARVDATADEFDAALTAMGWGIKKMDRVGEGFPDRIAVKGGRVVLLEYKNGRLAPSERQLRDSQVECFAWFKVYGIDVLLIEKVEDLQVLDRVAKQMYGEVTRA